MNEDGREVYYASYGSNLVRERFEVYLHGGCPPGSDRWYPPNPGGDADPTDDVWFERSEDWSFATGGRSTTWVDPDRDDRPGIAFLAPRRPGDPPIFFRAYRIARPQFAGLVQLENTARAQEVLPSIRLPPGLRTGRIEGAVIYDLLVRLGTLDGAPVVTITSAEGLPLNPPAPVYARHIHEGRIQARQRARRVQLDRSRRSSR